MRRKKSILILACFIVMSLVASLIVGGCTTSPNDMIEGTLAAANSEAEEVKTAALNFFDDHGVWPETSNNLTPTYLVGTLKADYDIDDDYGWLLLASNSTWDSRIMFQEGTPGPAGGHGHWVKK